MLSFTQFLHLFLFLLIGTPLLSQTRDYVESAYNIEDGLVYNDVVGILKDKHGYMWFGTKYGMSRFNGIDFKNFTHQPGDSTLSQWNDHHRYRNGQRPGDLDLRVRPLQVQLRNPGISPNTSMKEWAITSRRTGTISAPWPLTP